jgi:hypothetical protein
MLNTKKILLLINFINSINNKYNFRMIIIEKLFIINYGIKIITN